MAEDPREASGAPVGSPLRGRTVGGRYRVDSVLGGGGMGVVWAGHDQLLDRAVAIKEVFLPTGVDDADRDALRARTMRKAQTAARIWSEGSVAIYDVVEADGRPWIVMERLPPRTLEDELRERGRLPAEEVAEIGSALLAGLSAAHAAGILHRDVEPSNVMFRGGPGRRRAVLGDFGIAHFDGDATLTSTGMMVGSPAYIAPERAHGRAATVASDLWSLGVTMWAAVEGRSPFQRENDLASLTAVITEDVPPAEHAGRLGPVLEACCRRILPSGSTPPLLDGCSPPSRDRRCPRPPAAVPSPGGTVRRRPRSARPRLRRRCWCRPSAPGTSGRRWSPRPRRGGGPRRRAGTRHGAAAAPGARRRDPRSGRSGSRPPPARRRRGAGRRRSRTRTLSRNRNRNRGARCPRFRAPQRPHRLQRRGAGQLDGRT